MAWQQTAQPNSTTFERAASTPDRDAYTLPETIALNSESDQTLREAVEVKSSPYLGPVSLTNDRPSRILQAAHFAIADQSPFNLRNTDPRISIKDLNLPPETVKAPHVVAEVNRSTVSVPLPPRTNFDAANNPVALPGSLPKQAASLSTDSYTNTAESYRGVTGSYSPMGAYRRVMEQMSEPEQKPEIAAVAPVASATPAPVNHFNAAEAASSPLIADTGHVHAAWGLSEEPSTLKGALNSLLPGMGSAPKKASVSFEAGMPAARGVATDNNNSKAIKAGDALHTGRMGNSINRLREANRMQTCSSLPLFDTSSMRNKFQAANVTFSKSISPTGERTQVQTAPDFSSITEVWTPASDGSYLYKSVYRDELNRVRYEESVCEQGLRTIVQTGYCDKEDKKSPFVAYKMVIKPDGSRELLT